MTGADAFAFSALIVGLICGAGIWLGAYQTRLKNRERELELRARIAEAEAKGGQSELAQLEQRTRVLERIATDGKTKLAGEIEALRDERSMAE
jgi:hypothetical protein